MRSSSLAPCLAFALLLGCSEDSTSLLDATVPDTGPVTGDPDGGSVDAGPGDVGPGQDGAVDAGPGPCLTDPDCASCARDGECCFFSINCQPGSVCNTPDDDFYDPGEPDNVCIRVVCNTDEECDPDEICGLSGLCEDRLCQLDAECTQGEVCIGGACAPPRPQSAALSCEVVSHRYVLTNQVSARAEAVVRDAAGQPLPEVAVTWRSSEARIAAVDANGVVTVGTLGGQAMLQAEVAGIPCSGAVVVFVLDPIGRSSVRVTAVWSDDGAPVAQAPVTVIAGGQALEAVTDAQGTATVVSPDPATSVTVDAEPVHATVIEPGTRDVVVSVPRPTWPEAGGVQGAVDVSAVPRADVYMGGVGGALRADIAEVGRWPLFGRDMFETEIDAPELGVEETVDMPGGVLWGLGSRIYTENAERCGATPVGGPDLGCYTVTVPHGAQAVWTFAGAKKLSQLTGLANELASGDVPTAQGLAALTRVSRDLYHGVDPYFPVLRSPRLPMTMGADCTDPLLPNYLDQCRPDFTRYSAHRLQASLPRALDVVVALPNLPPLSPAGCATYASVMVAADLGPRGLVPLGIGAGTDVEDDTTMPDCRVAGQEAPFGDNSAPLQDGEVALSAAPRHSGLEGYPLRLVAVATSPGADGVPARSVLVRTVPSLPRSYDAFARGLRFQLPPEGTLDRLAGRVEVQAQGAHFVRLELAEGRRRWVVHAPADTAITLPDVPRPQSILQNADSFMITGLHGAGYAAVFDASAAARLDPNAQLDAVAARRILP